MIGMKRFLAALLALCLLCPAVLAEEPPVTEQGFLSDDYPEDSYSRVDDEAGEYVYLSRTLSVRVTRFVEEDVPRRYYVAEIRCCEENPLKTLVSEGKRPGRKLVNPLNFAKENEAVLALSDDFSGYRIQKGNKVGIVIRNGEILSSKTRSSRNKRGWPNLDTLAVFEDGRMEVNISDAYTAQEYLDMGAVQVFAFGPMLLKGGEYIDYVMEDDYYPYNEPRLAIGMIEPYHYIVLAAVGRTDDSKGARLSWMAEKLKSLGVQEALNLDGGGTAALMFMGQVLNRSSKNMRSINSLIAFK